MTDPAPHATRRTRTIRTATVDQPGSSTGPAAKGVTTPPPETDSPRAVQEPATGPAVPDGAPDRTARTLLRRLPRYQQIAEDVRAQISSGELAPGSTLPSETQMIDHYQVSRITVRHAVAALRAAGLVDTAHGRATTVRVRPGEQDAVTFDTAVTRRGNTWTVWDAHGWTDAEPPARYRSHAGPDAEALALNPAEPVFVVERLLRGPVGATLAHRMVVPFATVDATPALTDPFTAPGQLYAALTAAGRTLHWADTTRATMPTPDDIATLDLPDGVPLLTHTRTTLDADDRPLALEQTRLPADRITMTARQQPQPVRTTRRSH
jgi:GntR family transcriptional regulator